MTFATTRRRLGTAILGWFALLPVPALAQQVDTITSAPHGLHDTLVVAQARSVNTGGVMSPMPEGMSAFDGDLAVTAGVADSF